MEYNESTAPSSPEGNAIQDNMNPNKSSTDKSSTDKSGVGKASGAAEVKAPARPRGPNATAIVLGLVAMLLAGLIIAKETMNWRVDWSRLGPGAIVGIGVVMVVIGAIGLIRRHDDA